MFQFFVENSDIKGDALTITGGDVNHIKNVLRMRPGTEILAMTGEGAGYRCVITDVGVTEVKARILAPGGEGTELPNRIYLFQGLPKGSKMETVVQKAVELGAYAVIPVAMKNCVVRLDGNRAGERVRRWQSIAKGAAMQSGRGMIPSVEEPMGFAEALAFAAGLDRVLVPYEKERSMAATGRALNEICLGDSIGIFIGPEGGFAPEEIEAARAAGARLVSLGSRILRTETAGPTMLAVLMYTLESRAEENLE